MNVNKQISCPVSDLQGTREPHQMSERYLRHLLRRWKYLAAAGDSLRHGAIAERNALRWALLVMARDPSIPLTETQRTSGVLREIIDSCGR